MQLKRKILIISLILVSTKTLVAQINEIPCSNKQYLKTEGLVLISPDKNYFQIDALKDNAQIKALYNIRDTKINGIESYYKGLKIFTEGYTEAISNIPVISIVAAPTIAMTKEKIYQEAEKSIDKKTNTISLKFEEGVENLFISDIQRNIKNNSSITYNDAIQKFSNTLSSYKESLETKDYQIISPIVDIEILNLISTNRQYFEERFNKEVENLVDLQQKSEAELKIQFQNRVELLKQATVAYDKELLLKINENSESLLDFSNAVNAKFTVVQEDMKRMKADIDENKTKIESNTKRIKKGEEDIAILNKLQIENKNLLSENSYKIDIISGVLYENANTNGKIKLLDLKFRDDPLNVNYLENKRVLNNIQSVENIQSYLNGGQEVVTLAGHLGLSPETLKKANHAIAFGNVIANGAMAYFTGNPIAGLQAVNGALSLFGGQDTSNPEFEAIMAQFEQINRKLDLINEKLDTIEKEINELKQLNFDIYKENQKRFTRIDDKLNDIEIGVNNNNQLIYSDKSAALNVTNASQWNHLWNAIKNTSSLERLRIIYSNNQVVKDLVKIVYENTQTKTSDKKTFLHFNGKQFYPYWQNEIFSPILEIHNKLNSNYNYLNLEYPVVHIYDYEKVLNQSSSLRDNEIFPKLEYDDISQLLHPQSIITLTDFTSLFEPYYYFYSSNNSFDFNITEDIAGLDVNHKNRHLKIQFQNILKENRHSIIQANLMSGVSVLKYFYKNITDKTMPVMGKKKVYKLLNSENNYLKLNLANHIIHTEITQQLMLFRFKELEEATDFDHALKIAETINKNNSFENKSFKITVEGNIDKFIAFILIKPYGTDDFTNTPIYLPIPPFNNILESKVVYPEYFQALILNQENLMNKIIKYDIPSRIKNKPLYKNYQLLN